MARVRRAIAETRGTPPRSQGKTVVMDAPFILGHYITHPARLSLAVAEREGRVVGFQVLKRAWPDNPYDVAPGWGIIGTHIAPEAQGAGLGRAFFEVTRAAAARAGIETIDATIGADNPAGLGYYRSLGFKGFAEVGGDLRHRYDLPPARPVAGELHLRAARAGDAEALCAVLNPIIAAGGTTAHRRPFDPERMIRHYIAPPRGVACTLAERDGEVLGFQALERADPDWPGEDSLPEDWAVIATFVRPGLTQGGIGGRLFEVTRAAARDAGIVAIDATIRRENTGGLRYYSRMGFEDWRSDDERISKRLTP